MPSPKRLYFTYPELQQVNADEIELVELYYDFTTNKDPNTQHRPFVLKEDFTWGLLNDDFEAKLLIEDNLISITENGSNFYEENYYLHYRGSRRYGFLFLTKNSSGYFSESSIKIYFLNYLYDHVEDEYFSEYEKSFMNGDFKIKYEENGFSVFPDIYNLKHEIEEDGIRLELIINPDQWNNQFSSSCIQNILLSKSYFIKYSDIF